MSHHGQEGMPPGFLPGHIREQLGATGEFPNGKIIPEDEGEIRIAIGSKFNTVFMDFGKPTAWIGFTPVQARQIAATLMKHSLDAETIGHTSDDEDCGGSTKKS